MHAERDSNVPTRDELDKTSGPLVVEFGASWCGHCRSLKPHLEKLLEKMSGVPFLWVEDGRGKPLGRSFQVKLWPTLLFMRDGKVLQRSVRPSPEEVKQGLELLE